MTDPIQKTYTLCITCAEIIILGTSYNWIPSVDTVTMHLNEFSTASIGAGVGTEGGGFVVVKKAKEYNFVLFAFFLLFFFLYIEYVKIHALISKNVMSQDLFPETVLFF